MRMPPESCARIGAREAGEPDARDRLLRHDRRRRGGDAREPQRQIHVVEHASPTASASAPGTRSRCCAPARRRRRRCAFGQSMRARAGCAEAGDQPQQRRFAAAGGTEQAEELALGVRSGRCPAAHACRRVGFRDPVDADQGPHPCRRVGSIHDVTLPSRLLRSKPRAAPPGCRDRRVVAGCSPRRWAARSCARRIGGRVAQPRVHVEPPHLFQQRREPVGREVEHPFADFGRGPARIAQRAGRVQVLRLPAESDRPFRPQRREASGAGRARRCGSFAPASCPRARARAAASARSRSARHGCRPDRPGRRACRGATTCSSPRTSVPGPRSRRHAMSRRVCGWPPWLFRITSRRTPARATLSPISVHSASSVSTEPVSVPGNLMVLDRQPDRLRRQHQHRRVLGQLASARATMPWLIVVSTEIGRCGPCCSIAATGSTATVSARQGAERWPGQVLPVAGRKRHRKPHGCLRSLCRSLRRPAEFTKSRAVATAASGAAGPPVVASQGAHGAALTSERTARNGPAEDCSGGVRPAAAGGVQPGDGRATRWPSRASR